MRGNNIWDDPEWERLKQRTQGKRLQKRPRQAQDPKTVRDTANAQKTVTEPPKIPRDTKKVSVSLNLTLPKIKITKMNKRAAAGVAAMAVIGLAGTGIYKAFDRQDSTNQITDVLADKVTEPEFDTVLPEGKKENTDENKLGYDAQRKVASFKDSIGTTQITVSQQPLPEQFKNNPDEDVKKLAEGFSAYNVINESNPRAFLGNDVSGAQTVIFHKNDLLIFILSPKAIEKDQWAEYITKLL